jgi:F0F1-type ATP synthase membrane subunit c/vacuolar-type H+-ATPase subunit K
MAAEHVVPSLGVIAGLDPAIPIGKVGASIIEMAGTSPAMTI